MAELSTISKETAQKLLQEVGFDNRITGVKMSGSAGNQNTSIYSLKELKNFLRSDAFENLSRKSHSTMSYIDVEGMLRWIEDVYEDKELVEVMKAEMENAKSLADKLEIARELLAKRVSQCEELLGIK